MNGMSRQLCTFVVSLICVVLTQGCASNRSSGPSQVNYRSIAIVTRDAGQLLRRFPGAVDEIESRLRMALVQQQFHVVERARMQEVLDELNLGTTGITDERGPEVGNAAGAQAFLFADVSQFRIRKTWRTNLGQDLLDKLTSTTSSSTPDPGPTYEASVKILARLVDCEQMQGVWAGEAAATAIVFSRNDLGDAHIKAADGIAANLPRRSSATAAATPEP